MKKILSFFALAALLLTASCSKQESPVLGEDQVIISLGLEGVSATRAISDGSKVNQLVYEVYDKNGALLGTMDKTTEGPVTFPYSLSLPLAKGQDYTILFWAQNSGCEAYNTDDLRSVTVDYTGATNNDETRDAFYAAVNVHVTGGPQKVDVVLNRPFAQVNVAVPQAEWQRAIDAGVNVSQSSVVFTQEVAKKIDLLTGNVSEYASVQYTAEAIPTEKLTVNNEDYVYLSMSYILVGKEKSMVNNATFTFNSNVNAVTLSVPNLPVQRNYRTNVLGTFLVDYVDFNIVVDPIYNTPDEVYPDIDIENLYYAAANGGEVTLTGPVTLTAPIIVKKNMIVNLNGQTIINKVDNQQTDVFIVESDASLTINGEGIIEAVTGNDGYAIVSEGTVVINGGTFKAGKDANDEPNAVVYARGNGKVFVNGGKFPNENNSTFVLNKKDADRQTTIIEVRGGEFSNFNPQNNAAEGANTNFVAEGYVSLFDGIDTYVVKKGASSSTADELRTILSNPNIEDIYFVDDITSVGLGFEVRHDVTFNMNNKTFDAGSDETSKWYAIQAFGDHNIIINDANFTRAGIYAGNGMDITFNSGVIKHNPERSSRYIFFADGEGTTITIKDGEFYNDRPKNMFFALTNNATIYIKGGKFGGVISTKTLHIDSTSQLIITGGTFNFDPTAFVADGYKAVQSGSTWTVQAE